MPGRFITLEGLEGVGKSTQSASMARFLRSRRISVVLTREPGGTTIGEQLRALLLDRQQNRFSGEVELLLMFAARAMHLQEIIRPALARGDWVICDRFSDASFAYQVAGRGVDESLFRCLVTGIQQDLEPDCTIWLDGPPETGFSRINDRPLDRFESEDLAFFERVRNGYRELADASPHRIHRIDATRSVTDVEREIRHCLERLLHPE